MSVSRGELRNKWRASSTSMPRKRLPLTLTISSPTCNLPSLSSHPERKKTWIPKVLLTFTSFRCAAVFNNWPHTHTQRDKRRERERETVWLCPSVIKQAVQLEYYYTIFQGTYITCRSSITTFMTYTQRRRFVFCSKLAAVFFFSTIMTTRKMKKKRSNTISKGFCCVVLLVILIAQKKKKNCSFTDWVKAWNWKTDGQMIIIRKWEKEENNDKRGAKQLQNEETFPPRNKNKNEVWWLLSRAEYDCNHKNAVGLSLSAFHCETSLKHFFFKIPARLRGWRQ